MHTAQTEHCRAVIALKQWYSWHGVVQAEAAMANLSTQMYLSPHP